MSKFSDKMKLNDWLYLSSRVLTCLMLKKQNKDFSSREREREKSNY